MFAVPGWNLTATVKTQTAAPEQRDSKKRKRKDKEKKRTGESVETEKPQKAHDRKPESRNQEQVVEPSDVEGGTRKLNRNARRKNARDKRLEQNRDNAVTEVKSTESSERPNKKRKKEKNTDEHGSDAVKAPSSKSTEPAELAPITAEMAPKPPATKAKLTPLQAAMAHKLSSARFRFLNETLYTTPSAKSLSLFEKNPEMFDEYHSGFSQQVAVWPENPVDNFIKDILARAKIGQPEGKGKKFGNKNMKGRKGGKDSSNANLIPVNTTGAKPLPRNFQTGDSILADLGCGTARLSSTLRPHLSKLKLQVHSYDLHSPSPLVTKADISNLPLKDGELDITIFCLALMGTNWTDFIDEAWRCLHWKGECWVGEIRSRFGRVNSSTLKHSVGSQDKRKQQQQQGKNKKSNKRKAVEPDDSEDEDEPKPKKSANRAPDDYLNTEIDDPDQFSAQKAAAAQDTELGPFIQVMRNHGFSLEGEADLSNKMFVKMVFIKNVQPTTGKNVKEKPIEVKGPKGKKFVENDDNLAPEDEGKVLKPCVYKLR